MRGASSFRCGLALIVLGLSARAALAETFIIENGRPNAEIVVSAQAANVTKLAATQLQQHLETITGAKLPIVNTPSAGASVKIYVGPSAFTEKLGIKVDDLEHDSYRMVSGDHWPASNAAPATTASHSIGAAGQAGSRSDAGWLALVGRDIPFFQQRGQKATEMLRLAALKDTDPKRAELWEKWYALSGGSWGLPYGQLYKTYNEVLGIWQEDEHGSFNAVADFLRSLGMRWYMPGPLGQVMPKATSIALPVVNKKVEADFPVRFAHQRTFGPDNVDEALWELWMGFNRAADVLDATFPQHGIDAITDGSTNRSAFAHPGAATPKPADYYAMYGGKRSAQKSVSPKGPRKPGNQCYSSPGLFAENMRYAQVMFNVFESPMVSVMPADGYMSICQCPLCKGKDTPERGYVGLLSNYVWDYVNRIAREVYKTHPDRRILGTSYGTYRLPPTNIDTFSPNLVVCICQYRCEFGQRPETKERFVGLRKPFLDKLPPGKSLLMYEYYRGDRHTPHYSPHAIAEDLRALKGISLGDMIDVDRDGLPYLKKHGLSTLTRLSVQHLNLYVTGRCLWDANLDVDALLDEYYHNFYGPAAAEMKAFVEFGEANWMDILGDNGKIDTTLRLLKAVQNKVETNSVYGRRVAYIVDYIAPLEGLRDQGKIVRVDVPELFVDDCTGKEIKIDGKLDDPFWQKIRGGSKGTLKDMTTGAEPKFGTQFMSGWANENLYFGIVCQEEKGRPLNVTATERDQLSLWQGDCVEIELEPPGHSYYQIAISPSGAMADIDQAMEKSTRKEWSSEAEVATHVGEDSWSVEIRIPAMGLEQQKILPFQGVASGQPTEAFPWYFNIGRQRIRENGNEVTGFSPTGQPGFQVPEKFARLLVGKKKSSGLKKTWPEDMKKGNGME